MVEPRMRHMSTNHVDVQGIKLMLKTMLYGSFGRRTLAGDDPLFGQYLRRSHPALPLRSNCAQCSLVTASRLSFDRCLTFLSSGTATMGAEASQAIADGRQASRASPTSLPLPLPSTCFLASRPLRYLFLVSLYTFAPAAPHFVFRIPSSSLATHLRLR